MNYATIKNCDIANGPGVRVSLFVSGCTHRCPGCFNEVAWDFDYGEPFTQDTIDYILTLRHLLKRELMSNGILPKLGAMLSIPAFKSFKKIVDYAEYGGAPLLGLKGIAIVCHGKSNPKAISSAVKMANSYIAKGTQQRLVEAISANEELSSYAMSL